MGFHTLWRLCKMSRRVNIYVGTSGFYYEGWRGKFYPEDLPKSRFLQYYSGNFNTVELNSTFYHLPAVKTVEGWRKKVPKGFKFSVKGSRYITHRLKLQGVGEPFKLFMERVKVFGDRLGVVLFQLPPSLKVDLELLSSFVELFQRKNLFVMEFRHESWFTKEVYELLGEMGVAFCIQSHPRLPESFGVTADFIYARFHGVPRLYVSDYSRSELERWAGILIEASEGKRDIYCYFNNDVEGYAVSNAVLLRELLEKGL